MPIPLHSAALPRVLVTGATGFIGSHVARLLAERGDDVTLGVQEGSPDTAIAGLDCRRVKLEVRDRRYMGRYMGRDYVTVRGERQGKEVVFVETSVTRINLKSVIARVTRRPAAGGKVPLKAYGAVWGDGTPIARVPNTRPRRQARRSVVQNLLVATITAASEMRAKSILSGITVHVLTPRKRTARVSTEPAAQPKVAATSGVQGFIAPTNPAFT